MPIPPPQSLDWPADRALLLVHGIGNARPGTYDSIVTQLQELLPDGPKAYAIYTFYYDQVNEWFSSKVQAAKGVATLVSALRANLDATALGNAVADSAGDVVWPVLLVDAREAIRAAFHRQLLQIVRDGRRSNIETGKQRLSIIGHSLGCFHTFEALHAAAANPGIGLGPGTDGVVFDNVIFMASPVQLIRTVGKAIRVTIPQIERLTTVSAPQLQMPVEQTIVGPVASARRTVSITGDLDPVGGYLLGKRLSWAYMNLPGQESFVDDQDAVHVTPDELTALLTKALSDHSPPRITVESPHDWGKYIARHATDLRKWLDV